uniref:Anti-proliferative protein domain-containing protein n=1 Tax=Electrophorus electricus TaxID=8005 RepID=A0A4W4GNT5_ELEEL
MKEEIAATVFFVAMLAKKHGRLDRLGREKFAAALTSVLFETYKSHWYPEKPCKGQAFRCLRMNKAQVRDPIIERACKQVDVDYDDLGLPKEMTIWVDPGEVSCRYGEKTAPFCVTLLEGSKGDGEFSRRINNAVERASSDYHSGTSSDEEGCGGGIPEPKCIPTVSNPNSVYQVWWELFQRVWPTAIHAILGTLSEKETLCSRLLSAAPKCTVPPTWCLQRLQAFLFFLWATCGQIPLG